MSILWLIIGFIICLFMPAPLQMSLKVVVANAYKSIKAKFSKSE